MERRAARPRSYRTRAHCRARRTRVTRRNPRPNLDPSGLSRRGELPSVSEELAQQLPDEVPVGGDKHVVLHDALDPTCGFTRRQPSEHLSREGGQINLRPLERAASHARELLDAVEDVRHASCRGIDACEMCAPSGGQCSAAVLDQRAVEAANGSQGCPHLGGEGVNERSELGLGGIRTSTLVAKQLCAAIVVGRGSPSAPTYRRVSSFSCRTCSAERSTTM
jgi:hypothetical protein